MKILCKNNMKNYIVIGEILENGEIEKGETDQGFVYKNEEAFCKKSGVCYVPELSDEEYTYDDFYEIAGQNDEIAEILFEMVDWQSPESLIVELIANGEVNECVNCNKSYKSYNVDTCPYCGQKKVV